MWVNANGQRHPCLGARESKARRHNADDRMANSTELDYFSENSGVGRESLFPKFVAEHHDLVAPGFAFSCDKSTSNGRICPKSGEKLRGRIGHRNLGWIAGARQICGGSNAKAGDLFEGLVLLLKCQIIAVGNARCPSEGAVSWSQ